MTGTTIYAVSQGGFFGQEKYSRIHSNIQFIDETKDAELNNLVFPGREALYDYMRSLDGYIVPEPAPLIEKSTSKDVIFDTTEYKQQEYNNTVLDSLQRIMYGEKSKDSKKKSEKSQKTIGGTMR